MLEDDEFFNAFFEQLHDHLRDARVDRSELISLGLSSSLLGAGLTRDALWESEVEDFNVLYGRIGADDQTLLEIRLVLVVPLEVRFASEAYDSVAKTLDMSEPDLDEDAGYFRGIIQARCHAELTRQSARMMRFLTLSKLLPSKWSIWSGEHS